MTADTAPQPERQVHTHEQMIRYGIMVAAVVHMLLRDRRLHVTVITAAIGTYALFSVIKNNQARPMRRTIHWYNELGASKKLARGHQQARQELARAGQALQASKHSDLRFDFCFVGGLGLHGVLRFCMGVSFEASGVLGPGLPGRVFGGETLGCLGGLAK
jgi:hypothetical protein